MSKFTGSPKRVALYGAGGHAKVLKEIAELTGFDILCVIDKQKGKQLEKLESITEEEFLDYSKQHNIQNIILAIGNNTIREQIYERLNKNYHFPILIHPKAIISSSAHIQEGVVVCAGAIINSDAIIKRGAIINSGSIIEHDNCIDEFVHISPNATLAGNVHVGARSHIGAGSVIREGLSIGENCTIGAGAVVVKSILDNKKVVGNPANREL
nr:acetyltransferase [Helicobacter sp. 15-1451]